MKKDVKAPEITEEAALVEQQTTSLVESDESGLMMDLSERQKCYSSFNPKTKEERIFFFNAINSPQKRLKDCINMPIEVKHIYAETCSFVDEQTGEVKDGVRMVFISPDGTSYQAASFGIFNCTKKLFHVMGEPATWGDTTVTIVPKLVTAKANRNVLIFELA